MPMPDYPVKGRLTLLATLFVFASLFSGCVKEQTWKSGSPAPEISVLDLGDRTVKLSAYKGKPLVLRFWATGCKACVEGMPLLDAYSKRYAGRGLVVLAVNMGNPRELVGAFAKEVKLSYPLLLDPALIATRKYGVRSAPTTCFIDRRGIARTVVVGEVTREAFDKIAGTLL